MKTIIKNTKRFKKGFTLTEVLVVVLVIGVISAIAYPVYTKSINKSRAVEAINLLEMVRNKQIANFARRGEYLPTFSNMGQLTSNSEAEVKAESGAILMVNGKYELALNSTTNCMSASYIPAKGKAATFTFSSSYKDAGLGCDGDICKTFGNIVGSSSSVCNCGDKSCTPPATLNAKTCTCDCQLACTEGGCHDKNPARTETKNCGYNNSGTQTRFCPESCSSSCSASWGACTGETKECPAANKPEETEACGNCGTKTRTVTCDTTTGTWASGVWGACKGTKNETAACDAGYTGNKTRTCTNDVWGQWNISACTKNPIECVGAETEACANCGTKTRTCDKTTGIWGAWSACAGTKDETAVCDDGFTGNKTRTCSNDVWGAWNTSSCTPAIPTCSAEQCLVNGVCKDKVTSKQYNGKCYFYYRNCTCTPTGWSCEKSFVENKTQKGVFTFWGDTSPSSNKPTSTCSYRAINYLSPSGYSATPEVATTVCTKHIAGLQGTPDGTSTWSGSCSIVGNCWCTDRGGSYLGDGNAYCNTGLYRCQVRTVSCTEEGKNCGS